MRWIGMKVRYDLQMVVGNEEVGMGMGCDG